MIKQYLKKILNKLLFAERSAKKLTLSFCLGAYMAFTPYIALQTWLIIPLCWIFNLNATVAITSLYLISNPLTFVPIMISSYLFGYWLLNSVLHIDMLKYTPSWISSISTFLNKYINFRYYTGTDFCFWCFFIGGNLLGLIIAVILYPILKPLFTKLVKQFKKTSCNNNQDNNQK